MINVTELSNELTIHLTTLSLQETHSSSPERELSE